MQRMIGGLIRFLLYAAVFMVLRSPILMAIIGFLSGVACYHYYPELVLEYIAKLSLILNETTSQCFNPDLTFCTQAEAANRNQELTND
ncbi:MAG: hypothetical protein JXK16_06250 [Thiotrichales bacterium]|nr:hypothetical protein [Thiotrichales bacterium]